MSLERMNKVTFYFNQADYIILFCKKEGASHQENV